MTKLIPLAGFSDIMITTDKNIKVSKDITIIDILAIRSRLRTRFSSSHMNLPFPWIFITLDEPSSIYLPSFFTYFPYPWKGAQAAGW